MGESLKCLNSKIREKTSTTCKGYVLSDIDLKTYINMCVRSNLLIVKFLLLKREGSFSTEFLFPTDFLFDVI